MRKSGIIYLVTQLQESGVKFKQLERSGGFYIKFNDGVLEIPLLKIEDQSKSIFRNLIAYEQYSQNNHLKLRHILCDLLVLFHQLSKVLRTKEKQVAWVKVHLGNPLSHLGSPHPGVMSCQITLVTAYTREKIGTKDIQKGLTILMKILQFLQHSLLINSWNLFILHVSRRLASYQYEHHISTTLYS